MLCGVNYGNRMWGNRIRPFIRRHVFVVCGGSVSLPSHLVCQTTYVDIKNQTDPIYRQLISDIVPYLPIAIDQDDQCCLATASRVLVAHKPLF